MHIVMIRMVCSDHSFVVTTKMKTCSVNTIIAIVGLQ
jgi:hypothetical protein